MDSFSKTVESLASPIAETQLSAAILMRRYLNLKYWFIPFLLDESVNVISSILRTLPTGVFQKTLGDSLAYAQRNGLSHKDIQYANLQNIYLGNKNRKLKCYHTDFFRSDLSYALVENIRGKYAIFHRAILNNTSLKNCDFSHAYFSEADLTQTGFKNVDLRYADFSKAELTDTSFENIRLYKAKFTGAINIPEAIRQHLDEEQIYTDKNKLTFKPEKPDKVIFFSMPGIMSKSEEALTKAYKEFLKRKGYEVIYYEKDHYPKFGQLGNVCANMRKCAGVIAFGFKQTSIWRGSYRPGTSNEKQLHGEWLSTPWNEIEVGMATMRDLPILLVHDKAVTQGIFDDILSEHFVKRIHADYDIRKLDCQRSFQEWIKLVDERTDKKHQ